MKRKIIPISMIIMALLLSGCNNKDTNKENDDTVTPTVTIPADNNTEEVTGDNGDKDEETLNETEWTLQDYYPMKADAQYVFEGTGNEYASFIRVTDFLDETNGRIQTRTNNGGTETVRVIEIQDGKLSVVNMINECYYRDSIMDKDSNTQEEVLLMEPIVTGTEWTLSDGRKRYISAIDVEVVTPSGNYKALEVTTEGENDTTTDYYAPQVGLVKSIFKAENMEVTSALREVKEDTAYNQTLELFYPDVDEKLYVEPVTLTFRTNDETKEVFQKAISQEVLKASYLPLASVNTRINSIELQENKLVHIDFSAELVSDMNAGAGYEFLIMQGITNTLGNYYGVQEVLITVDGKPYESGHILMKEGETFKVNMDSVIR